VNLQGETREELISNLRAASTRESDIEPATSNLDRKARNVVYLVSGLTILACMAGIGTCFFLVPSHVKVKLNALGFVFWVEWLAVWAFSAAWLTKGRAIFDDVAETPSLALQMTIDTSDRIAVRFRLWAVRYGRAISPQPHELFLFPRLMPSLASSDSYP